MGIALEVETFDVGHVVSAVRWLEQGVIPEPLRINLVFGVPGGIDASPEALDAMLRPLPSDAFWTVTCIGRHHQRMLGLALLKGAPGIRTGLEDVAYISRGVLAPSNGALVEMAAGLAESLGREVASQEQTRELLNLG
jgi:3-keto-5-aminohexanoate cleavage enzyme